jgi:hypothetical protein
MRQLLLLLELLSRRFSRGFVQEKSLVYLSSEFLFPHLGFSLFLLYFPAKKKKKKFSKISTSFSCCFCGSPGVEISDSVSESFVSEILFGLWFSELVLASPQLQSSQQPVR